MTQFQLSYSTFKILQTSLDQSRFSKIMKTSQDSKLLPTNEVRNDSNLHNTDLL